MSKKRAVICDIDGTLARMCERGVYEHEKAIDDHLCKPVANVVNLYAEAGYAIIILTGRFQAHAQVTQDWLFKHNIPHHVFWCRDDGDYRKDAIVKREIYEQHIAPHYTVEVVLDDRNQVVDMWRKELGLTCFQVNYGDF